MERSSKELERSLKKQKIEVHTSTRFESARRTDTGVEVKAKTAKGQERTWEVEKLLVAVGRQPVSDGLGYAEAGVRIEKGFVVVDDHMRTNVPGVFAIGDLVPTPGYAHTASAEAVLVAEQVAGLPAHPIRYELTPNCTYCDPEVASVGLTEAVARERGYDVKVGKFPLGVLGRVLILDEPEGMVKIVADAKYGEILGMHIVGPRATEMIAEGGMALVNGLMAYLAGDAKDGSSEAHSIGYEYASRARRYNLSTVEATQAYLFFRNNLVEAILRVYQDANIPSGRDWGEMLRRVNHFTDEVLLALLQTFQAFEEKKT